ncbi:Uncharacterized protein Fot_15091 [Forsythia ovata]|uniref:Uncharacterized protein n=1 Tax=Forsythia ovata TaxID=205694 RepID=A0ABD1WAL0_9LAMI
MRSVPFGNEVAEELEGDITASVASEAVQGLVESGKVGKSSSLQMVGEELESLFNHGIHDKCSGWPAAKCLLQGDHSLVILGTKCAEIRLLCSGGSGAICLLLRERLR